MTPAELGARAAAVVVAVLDGRHADADLLLEDVPPRDLRALFVVLAGVVGAEDVRRRGQAATLAELQTIIADGLSTEDGDRP